MYIRCDTDTFIKRAFVVLKLYVDHDITWKKVEKVDKKVYWIGTIPSYGMDVQFSIEEQGVIIRVSHTDMLEDGLKANELLTKVYDTVNPMSPGYEWWKTEDKKLENPKKEVENIKIVIKNNKKHNKKGIKNKKSKKEKPAKQNKKIKDLEDKLKNKNTKKTDL
jgi:hypothetical protein